MRISMRVTIKAGCRDSPMNSSNSTYTLGKLFEMGQDIHSSPGHPPKQSCYTNREFKVKKGTLTKQAKQDIMNKYGDAAASADRPPVELLQGQSERQIEYDQAGGIIQGQEKAVPKSKYEEDVFINNH